MISIATTALRYFAGVWFDCLVFVSSADYTMRNAGVVVVVVLLVSRFGS